MGELSKTEFGKKWICPNDRGLSLLARVGVGWSVKTQHKYAYQRPPQLSDSEKQVIVGVVKRAEELECLEKQRVGKLVHRLENLKKNACGSNSSNECFLCNTKCKIFGLVNARGVYCCNCGKIFCQKCAVQTLGTVDEPIWTCKICYERREVWKKSNAWFYNDLPPYTLPEKTDSFDKTNIYGYRTVISPWAAKASMKPTESEEESSSEEDQRPLGSRLRKLKIQEEAKRRPSFLNKLSAASDDLPNKEEFPNYETGVRMKTNSNGNTGTSNSYRENTRLVQLHYPNTLASSSPGPSSQLGTTKSNSFASFRSQTSQESLTTISDIYEYKTQKSPHEALSKGGCSFIMEEIPFVPLTKKLGKIQRQENTEALGETGPKRK